MPSDPSQLPPARNTEQLAALFKALGSPVRLRLVEELLHGEKCVCELHGLSGLNLDLSTISNHLAILRNSGIVLTDKRGKNIYYRIACPCLASVIRCLSGSV